MRKPILIQIVSAVICLSLLLIYSEVSADTPKEIRLGMIPELGKDATEMFKPLARYLEQEIGVPVKILTSKDYDGIITALMHKHIDFAYLGPRSYVEAAEKVALEPLVADVNEQKEVGYYGLIISKKDSGIDSMEKAKGRGFAFTEPLSTSGCLVPNILFVRDMKISPKTYFKEVRFSGSHKDSILGVKNGSIEVAASNTLDIGRMEAKGEVSFSDFNILWKSELIPSNPFCARKELPDDLRNAFRNAMLKFNDPESLKQFRVSGYAPIQDKAYDVIREMIRLKKELEK